jgi:uncharacterized protein
MRPFLPFLAACLFVALAAFPAHAAEAGKDRVIVVSGEGEVAAAPDRARLSAGVLTEAETAAAALDANTAAMNRVFAALRMAGIPDTKMQTSNFSVSPQYAPYRGDNAQPRTITGYQVANQVTVTVDDLSKLGSVIDAAVRSGANQSYGLSFDIADPKPYQAKARAAAVADAAAKAKTLADAAGVRLGPILAIQEDGGPTLTPSLPLRAMALAAPAPVAAGEETVRVNVTLTYAIP